MSCGRHALLARSRQCRCLRTLSQRWIGVSGWTSEPVEDLVETVLEGKRVGVTIAPGRPTVLIGERINPTGHKRLAESLRLGDLGVVEKEAVSQASEGAKVIDVNVGLTDVDEPSLLPEAVSMAAEATGLPICIDTSNPQALDAALKICPGRPLVNSVNGEEGSLDAILPIVKQYGVAVIGLAMDERGISKEPQQRLRIAEKILDRAARLGIDRQDVVIDPLALSVGADQQAAVATLETVRLIAQELGVNMTVGGSNASFGLPDRESINGLFLGLVIAAGVTCPIVNPRRARKAVLVVDLLLGRDEYALRYISHVRERP
jgi:5-methyltetrahydrofolate--homocysteine methyltransferase